MDFRTVPRVRFFAAATASAIAPGSVTPRDGLQSFRISLVSSFIPVFLSLALSFLETFCYCFS